MMRTILILSITALLALLVVADPRDAYRIQSLTGLPQGIKFTQYSGRVLIDAASQRKSFFWFVQSQNNPTKDPVVLWVNGGPGCSSLAGLLSENGPLWASGNNYDLEINEAAWTRAANV
eukprot:EC720363.1.p1 GENE.EC720363.1~~EC720363.1.p1  ORF type:complete len:119 (+),score=8.63 EC720363.1:15-371(+)